MPKEVRLLLFSPAELTEIGFEWLCAHGRLGPQASVALRGMRSKPEAGMLLAIRDQTSETQRWLCGSELAAAIIRYCKGRRTPLPARAGKSLHATPDGMLYCLSSGLARQDLARLFGRHGAATGAEPA
jgi:hypothetical protein